MNRIFFPHFLGMKHDPQHVLLPFQFNFERQHFHEQKKNVSLAHYLSSAGLLAAPAISESRFCSVRARHSALQDGL